MSKQSDKVDEFRQQEKVQEWLQKSRELNLDPTCDLFLLGDPKFEHVGLITRNMPIVGAVITAASSSVYGFFTSQRPVWAGMPKHIAFGLVGLAAGFYLKNWKIRMTAENDVFYFYYMTLHPEDFRPREKILYNDYLTSWIPIR